MKSLQSAQSPISAQLRGSVEMYALLKEIQFNSGTSVALVTAEEMKKAQRSVASSVAILWLISIKQVSTQHTNT